MKKYLPSYRQSNKTTSQKKNNLGFQGSTLIIPAAGPASARQLNPYPPFPVSRQPAFKNKKIQNATKVEIDGIRFDSKLESYFYGRLKQLKIEFEFQKKYEIQPGFTYHGKKIQNIDIIVDFYLPKQNCIIDTKGFQTEVSKVKYKMLRHLFHIRESYSQELSPIIHIPSTKKLCDELLIKIVDLI